MWFLAEVQFVIMQDDQGKNNVLGFLNYRIHKNIHLSYMHYYFNKGSTLENERLWNTANCLSSIYCQKVDFFIIGGGCGAVE